MTVFFHPDWSFPIRTGALRRLLLRIPGCAPFREKSLQITVGKGHHFTFFGKVTFHFNRRWVSSLVFFQTRLHVALEFLSSKMIINVSTLMDACRGGPLPQLVCATVADPPHDFPVLDFVPLLSFMAFRSPCPFAVHALTKVEGHCCRWNAPPHRLDLNNFSQNCYGN